MANGDMFTLKATDIRDYAANKHNKVDDTSVRRRSRHGHAGSSRSIGAYEAVKEQIGYRPRVIYLTPQGRVLLSAAYGGRNLQEKQDLVFLCGHYEGHR